MQARLIGSRRAWQKLWAGGGAEERVEGGGGWGASGGGAEGLILTALVDCLWWAVSSGGLEGTVLHPSSLFVMLLSKAVMTVFAFAVCLAGTDARILLLCRA